MRSTSSPGPATVLLADNHEIVRDGLRVAFEHARNLCVVGEASTAKLAEELVRTLRPDIVVLDLNLPDRDGIALCSELANEDTDIRCVVFTSDTSPETFEEARKAGASAYLLKTESSAHVLGALKRIADGEELMQPANKLSLQADIQGWESSIDSLTGREREIFLLLADGLSNRQIAERLFLAEKTVKNYVSNLLMKLGLSRRAEATAISARHAERRQLQRARLGYTAA